MEFAFASVTGYMAAEKKAHANRAAILIVIRVPTKNIALVLHVAQIKETNFPKYRSTILR